MYNKCNRRECNNGCRPQCNPCNKQPQILYCGQPIECLNIRRGDELNRVIKTIGDKVCQVLTDVSTLNYVNVEPASDEQCPTGGYVFQVINIGTGEIESETVICDTLINVLENSEEVGTYNSFNFVDGQNTKAEVTDNSNTVDITFNVELSKSITYDEGLDLISDEEIVPGVSYFISDRGIYLKGIDVDKFSAEGTRVMTIVKPEYYEKIPLTNIKGVYHPHSQTTAQTGDLFVWGAKVWRATANVSSISPVNTIDLGAGFTQDNNPNFYKEAIFSIEYDYINDDVYKQTDKNGNTILKGDTVNCDWGQLEHSNVYGNIFGKYLNNYKENSTVISHNDVIEFYGNYITAKAVKNYSVEIKNNIFVDMAVNKVIYIHDNKSYNIISNDSQEILNNTCEYVTNNKVRYIRNNFTGAIQNNNCEIIDDNRYYEFITNNHGNYIRENVVYGDKDSIVSGSDISDNFTMNIANNQSYNIRYNSVLFIENNEFISNIESNRGNTISNNIATEESPASILNNYVHESITGNSDFEIISGNSCLNINNNNSTLITNNDVRDDINDNNSTGTYFYMIVGNKNNGGIYRNVPTTASLSITSNVNNGHIGVTTSDTNRSSDVTDTVTNK